MGMLDDLQGRIQRHRDRDFLKAAMAASALAAYADGTVSLSERYGIDDLLANLKRLCLHDPRKAVQILDAYIRELKENTEAAEAVLNGKLKRIARDPEAAQLVAGIALAISYADGQFNYAEKMQFDAICEILNVEPDSIEPVLGMET